MPNVDDDLPEKSTSYQRALEAKQFRDPLIGIRPAGEFTYLFNYCNIIQLYIFSLYKYTYQYMNFILIQNNTFIHCLTPGTSTLMFKDTAEMDLQPEVYFRRPDTPPEQRKWVVLLSSDFLFWLICKLHKYLFFFTPPFVYCSLLHRTFRFRKNIVPGEICVHHGLMDQPLPDPEFAFGELLTWSYLVWFNSQAINVLVCFACW